MALGILAGLVCGVLSGLGVGGGSILMVWLTAVAGLEQRAAQGINLLYFLPTALASLFFHIRNRYVDPQAAFPAILSGAAAAAAGALLAQRMDTGLLRRFFGTFLLIVAVFELKKAAIPSKKDQKPA